VLSFVLVALFVHPPEFEAPEDKRGALAGARFIVKERLLRVWFPAFTVLDVCWTLLFASLPVLVVTEYSANPKIVGWLFGALGGGAVVGALTALKLVRRVEPLTMTAVCFVCQMSAIWLVDVPGSWVIAATGMALAGFFMSLVNAPLHALITLRVPRELRPQSLAAAGVFQSIGSPIGLLLAGWALSRFDTRSVLAFVLATQTVAVATIVSAALAERSSLRAATVDSAA
jgi:MFS family permease